MSVPTPPVPDPAPAPTPAPPPDPGRFMTNTELGAMASREKDQGRRSGIRELAKAAGLPEDTRVEDLVAALQAGEQARTSKLTADQKISEDTQRAAAAAAADREKAAGELLEAKISRAVAMQGGTDTTMVTRIIRPDLTPGSADADIEAAVLAAKAKAPSLFGGTAPTPAPPPGSPAPVPAAPAAPAPAAVGDPGRPPTTPAPAAPTSFGGGGLAEAARRFNRPTTPAS